MDRVPKFMVFTAARIAEEGIEATLSGKRLCVPTKTYKLIVFMQKYIPQFLLAYVANLLAPGRYDND